MYSSRPILVVFLFLQAGGSFLAEQEGNSAATDGPSLSFAAPDRGSSSSSVDPPKEELEEEESLREEREERWYRRTLPLLSRQRRSNEYRKCGVHLTNRISEVCNSCVKTHMKRSLNSRSKRGVNLVGVCCVAGKCTDALLKVFCCTQ